MVIIMTQKKMKWKCPSCPQTSARRWNIEVHIKRKHLGHGLPVSDHDASVKLQERYSDIGHHSMPYNIFRDQDVFDSLWPFTPGKDSFDDLLNGMQSMLYRMSIFNNIPRRLYNQTLPPVLPRDFGHSIYGPPFHNNIGNYIYPSETGLQKENFDGVTGFIGKVCKMCLTISIIPSLQRGKIEHSCNSDRLNEIKHLADDQKKRLSASLEQDLPNLLFRRCKEWANDGVYLQAQAIGSDHISSVRIDIEKIKNNSWIMRAINQYQIPLKDPELLKFLQMVHFQTATFVCIYSSRGTNQTSYYQFAIRRKHSLNTQF
jgi:hypothetical protein